MKLLPFIPGRWMSEKDKEKHPGINWTAYEVVCDSLNDLPWDAEEVAMIGDAVKYDLDDDRRFEGGFPFEWDRWYLRRGCLTIHSLQAHADALLATVPDYRPKTLTMWEAPEYWQKPFTATELSYYEKEAEHENITARFGYALIKQVHLTVVTLAALIEELQAARRGLL